MGLFVVLRRKEAAERALGTVGPRNAILVGRELGCRRITFAAYSNSASTVEARIAGYREALFVWSGSIEPTLVQRLETGDESEVGRMMETLKPEAIIGANDRTAGQFMQSLIRLNYQVPKDVRIAGIDDVGYASLLPVPYIRAGVAGRNVCW